MDTINLNQSLVEMFEINKLPIEKQTETIERLAKIILQGTLVRALPSLTETEEKEFNALADRGAGAEEIFGFLESRIPNFERILLEEMETFKSEVSKDIEDSLLD